MDVFAYINAQCFTMPPGNDVMPMVIGRDKILSHVHQTLFLSENKGCGLRDYVLIIMVTLSTRQCCMFITESDCIRENRHS